MPDDIWYGGDCEARIGVRADRNTAPTAWRGLEYMSLTMSPNQERRTRAKLGVVRHNTLDPIRPRKAFFRLNGELVLDADSRGLPLFLRAAIGAPASDEADVEDGEGDPVEGLYDHVFESGRTGEHYFDLAIKVGAAKFRIYEGLTLAQISTQFTGETTQDFNINISLTGLRRKRATAWPAGAVTPAPEEAPILRALFLVDGEAASNMLGGNWSWGRTLQEGIHLSSTPTISNLRPNGATHSGSANYRAMGDDFDVLEENDTAFSAAFNLLGVEPYHAVLLENPEVLLAPSPLPITGVGMIERTINWSPYQEGSAPAARITIRNDVEEYA